LMQTLPVVSPVVFICIALRDPAARKPGKWRWSS